MNTLKRFVWIGLAILVGAAASTARAEVTDDFRLSPMSIHPFFSGNYNKDAAVLCPWNVRAEFSGQSWHRFRGNDVQSYDFLLSFGLIEGLEIGAILPLNVLGNGVAPPATSPVTGQGDNKGIGNVSAYGKYRILDTDMFDLVGGFEYQTARTQDPKIFMSQSTGQITIKNGVYCTNGAICTLGFPEASYTPFGAMRATFGDVAVGGHFGYMFYENPLGDMVNWDVDAIYAPLPWLGLRLEFTGFNQVEGPSQNVIAMQPGVDFIFDRFTFRIGGAKGFTDDTADWTLGGGVAVTLGERCDEELPPPPPPPPPPAAAPPPPAPTKKRIVLRGVNFDFDKSNIRPVDVPVLEEAVKTLKEEGMPSVIAIGYTDSVGTDAYNQKLSERRANSVKAWLVDHGIAASKITAEGRGESDPVATNETADGRAQNRRVELKVVE